MTPSFARKAVRASVAGLFLVLVGPGGAGMADTPANWEDSPPTSFLQYALVLFLIPIGLFIVITVLTVLPSLVKGSSREVTVRAEDEPHLDAPRR